MSSPTLDLRVGGCLPILRTIADRSVRCCVTSPPYYGLRDYGVAGQIGLEPTLGEFIDKLVAVFTEVKRVLTDDGTLWLNLGDSYSSHAGQRKITDKIGMKQHSNVASSSAPSRCIPELGAKQLIGVPWRVAFALQESGWILRSEIIWHKPNPMPESVTDRPTKSHEQIFLFAKSEKYFYDQEATLEPVSENTNLRISQDLANQIGSERANAGIRRTENMKAVRRSSASWKGSEFHKGKTAEHQLGRSSTNRKQAPHGEGIKNNESFTDAVCLPVDLRNKRTVWTVPTYSYRGAHFATFPPDLIKPCILAGTAPGDFVLDPFGGSGTTGQVALELGRSALLIELNPDYAALIRERCAITPGLALTTA